MKINLEALFFTKDKEPITNSSKFYISDILKLIESKGGTIPAEVRELEGKNDPLTLGEVIYEAVTSIASVDTGLAGKAKYDYYKISQKLGGKEVDLEAEEITKVKEAIGKIYNNVVLLGQAWDLLENKK